MKLQMTRIKCFNFRWIDVPGQRFPKVIHFDSMAKEGYALDVDLNRIYAATPRRLIGKETKKATEYVEFWCGGGASHFTTLEEYALKVNAKPFRYGEFRETEIEDD